MPSTFRLDRARIQFLSTHRLYPFAYPPLPRLMLLFVVAFATPYIARGSLNFSSLDAELTRALFYNNGTVKNTDRFVYVPMSVSYNEPDNVTCSMCGWAGHSPWYYEWQQTGPAPSPGSCKTIKKTADTDILGNDLEQHPEPTFDACFHACCATPGCGALLFEAKSDTSFGTCVKGAGCCFLKTAAGPRHPKPAGVGATSAIIDGRQGGQPTLDQVAAPPTGYRSAPALGGVAAGSAELRADGSFREWTIFNQGPAGSGKYGLADDVYMGVKIGSSARIVRTKPPGWTRSLDDAVGVESLTFSGTYPLTRLIVADTSLAGQQEVYGYSTLKPTSLKESAYPAIVLTLRVHNPTSEDLDAAFMFAVPFGAWTDCSRTSSNSQVIPAAQTYQECMHSCTKANNCSSWEFTTSTARCTANSDVPYTAHKVGSYCGVRSDTGWTKISDRGEALFRSQRPTESNPSMGDITLQPVAGERTSISVTAEDDPAVIWSDFARNGKFSSLSSGRDAAHGAAAVSAKVPAKGNATLSIVFAWHFPDRDFSHEILGNMYAELWQNSSTVAAELGHEGRLTQVVKDINAHHQVIAHPDNPTPVWLKDMLINQWSHYHMLMWYRDGRLREYEAWSCDDVDSVHNDYQRHLLYLWAFPEFEFNKMRAWSTFAQDKDGHIWESLGYTGKPMDVGGGRLMGDTTSIYLIEMYEILLHTGNKSFVQGHWESAKRAAAWMITNAGDYGLPQKLETTYDHFGFKGRQTVVYNCHIYLSALKAMRLMANLLGDATTAANVAKAYQRGQSKLVQPVSTGGPLWNDTLSFFLAHSETQSQVFTDSLYGQMLSHYLFNGSFTLSETYLSKHLLYEWQENQDLYGMRVLSNPIQEDSIWMNGPPTWTYLSLALGHLQMEEAFEPFKRMSENFRSRLHDMWNLRALTHSQTEGTELEHGQPREQGHYGFMLTDLFLLPLLSGQNIDMTRGQLSLKPRFDPPYVVPVLISMCEASLSAKQQSDGSETTYTVEVAFGSLKLASGGLSVDTCVYPDAVDLKAGQMLTWYCASKRSDTPKVFV